MKLLQVNHYGHHVGGGEAYVAEAHSGLLESGDSALLAYLEPEVCDPLLHESLSLAQPDSSGHRERELIRSLRRLLVNYAPDVAFVHSLYSPSILEYLARALPTVAYVHSPYPVCPGSGYYLRRSGVPCTRAFGLHCVVRGQIERCCWGRNPARHAFALIKAHAFRRAYQSVSMILVGSEFMRDLLVRNGYPGRRISILAPIMLRDAPSTPSINQNPPRMLFAARLVREKGLHLLLEALAQVDAHWTLLIGGDGEERQPLERLAHSLGLSDRVEFAGFVNAPNMYKALGSCSFVIVPSLWPEPFGRLGPEAAIHAKPAIAFDVGGVRSWLDDGKTGLLVQMGDVRGLASAISKLLHQPDLCIAMGERAREKAKTEWAYAQQVTRLRSLLSQATELRYRLPSRTVSLCGTMPAPGDRSETDVI